MLYTSERAVAGYRHLTGLRFGKRYLVSASFVYYKHASTNKIASPLPLSNKLGMYGASRLCVPEAAKGPMECLSKRPVVPQNYPDL